MTQRDRWGTRPATRRYWAYKDEIRAAGVWVPEGNFHVTFVIPIPKSWSKVKRDAMRGKPHQQKPDKDNLEKGLLDAIFDDDCRVWDSRVTKIWGDRGEIWIAPIERST